MPNFLLQLGDTLVLRFSQILYRCMEEVGSTKAALYLREPDSGTFHRIGHYGWPRQLAPPERLEPDSPVLTLVQRERRGLAVNQPSQFPELQPFGGGSEAPRYLLSPIFQSGEWVGLLVQRDRTRGAAYDVDRDAPATQEICQSIVEAWKDFRLGLTAPPPPPATTGAPAPAGGLPVSVPPSEGMVQGGQPASSQAGELLEGFHHAPGADHTGFTQVPDELTFVTRNLDETSGGTGPGPAAPAEARRLRAGSFLPEQRGYFWEAASLLCSLVPVAAVSLWMEELLEVRPVLTYSRQPLSPELKQQVLAHVTYHVPKVVQRDLRILTRVEYLEREPLLGAFQTYLPVMLMGSGEAHDLLLLFRMDDRPFTELEQGYIQMVGRLLGFHLQEVRLHERYHRAFLSVSHQLLSSVEGGAPQLKDHSTATARLCRSFGMHLELPAEEVEALSLSAILHDVGTFLLDPRLLSKPGLTEEEKTRLRTHPILASTFLKDLRFPFDVLGIIRHHHERWDGKGYPDGLRGEAIPLGSRIINLVEAFEVITTGSAFKPARSLREAMDELRRESGGQFDPTLVVEFTEFIQARRRGDLDEA